MTCAGEKEKKDLAFIFVKHATSFGIPGTEAHDGANQHGKSRPQLCNIELATANRQQRATDRWSRHGCKADDSKRHAHSRAHFIQPVRDARHRGGRQALEGRGEGTVEYRPDVVAANVLHGEPEEGDDGPGEDDGDQDVEGTDAVRDHGDDDAEGDAYTIDDDNHDGGHGVVEAKDLCCVGGDLY